MVISTNIAKGGMTVFSRKELLKAEPRAEPVAGKCTGTKTETEAGREIPFALAL
jgi:hypothetical protein